MLRYVNNQRERYDFKFNGLFDADAKQEKVCRALKAMLRSEAPSSMDMRMGAGVRSC